MGGKEGTRVGGREVEKDKHKVMGGKEGTRVGGREVETDKPLQESERYSMA
jgi:hypothetical protein